jgi:hypothetical protein
MLVCERMVFDGQMLEDSERGRESVRRRSCAFRNALALSWRLLDSCKCGVLFSNPWLLPAGWVHYRLWCSTLAFKQRSHVRRSQRDTTSLDAGSVEERRSHGWRNNRVRGFRAAAKSFVVAGELHHFDFRHFFHG